MRKLLLMSFLLLAVVLASFQVQKINDNRSSAASPELNLQVGLSGLDPQINSFNKRSLIYSFDSSEPISGEIYIGWTGLGGYGNGSLNNIVPNFTPFQDCSFVGSRMYICPFTNINSGKVNGELKFYNGPGMDLTGTWITSVKVVARTQDGTPVYNSANYSAQVVYTPLKVEVGLVGLDTKINSAEKTTLKYSFEASELITGQIQIRRKGLGRYNNGLLSNIVTNFTEPGTCTANSVEITCPIANRNMGVLKADLVFYNFSGLDLTGTWSTDVEVNAKNAFGVGITGFKTYSTQVYYNPPIPTPTIVPTSTPTPTPVMSTCLLGNVYNLVNCNIKNGGYSSAKYDCYKGQSKVFSGILTYSKCTSAIDIKKQAEIMCAKRCTIL